MGQTCLKGTKFFIATWVLFGVVHHECNGNYTCNYSNYMVMSFDDKNVLRRKWYWKIKWVLLWNEISQYNSFNSYDFHIAQPSFELYRISVIRLKKLTSNLFFMTKQSLSACYELHSRVPVSHQPPSSEIPAEILIFHNYLGNVSWHLSIID